MSNEDRKTKLKNVRARLEALKVPPAPFDQLQRAAYVVSVDTLLRDAFALFERESDRPEEEAAWREAAELFHASLEAGYPEGFWDNFQRWRWGETETVDIAISFLESDPWFFRTGYIKADLIQYVRRMKLSPQQMERLRGVVLNAIDSRDRREFRSYCKLAKRMYSNSLQKEVEKRVSSDDAGVRRRARWVLSAITHNKVFHLNLGCSKFKSKLYAEAIGHFTRAIYLEPACVRAFLCRSRVYAEMKEPDLAIDDLTKVIELSKVKFVEAKNYESLLWMRIRYLVSDAHRERAAIYEEREEKELAIADYSGVLDEKPRDAFALGRRGRLYFETGNFDDCLEDFNRCLLVDTSDGYAYYWRGRAYTAKEQYDLAADEFILALTVNPRDHFSWQRLSDVYELMGKHQEAQECAAKSNQIWESDKRSESS
jgi:tetratricopeptide (TPR) repeat protein